MACKNSEKRTGRSSEDFLPWKLIPVDVKPKPGGSTRNEQPSSSEVPKGTSSTIHPPIPVELSDTSFIELKTVLSKVCANENMAFLDSVIDQLVLPSAILEPITSSMSSELVVEQPKHSSEDVKNIVKHTPLLENKSNRTVSPPRKPEPISAMKPTSIDQNANETQPGKLPQNSPNGSKIKKEDTRTKFINLVREFPHLYDTKDSSNKAVKQREKSWTVISEVLGMTVNDCLLTWEKLRAKYKRNKKELEDGRHMSEKTMQFLNDMSFLSRKQKPDVKRKNISEDFTMPVIAPKKRKKTRSFPEVTLSASLSCRTPEAKTLTIKETKPKNQSPSPDQLFTDNIALELKRVSPHVKNVIKAKIWQVFAEFANPV